MSNYECRKKASMLLKHRYGEGFFAVMIIIGAFFILKIFDIAQIGLLLYNNGMDTKSLFHSSFIWELILKLCSAFITLAVMTPLITGGLWWFYETASGGDNKSILKLYAGIRLNIRAAALYALMWIKTLISLIPSGLCFALSFVFYRRTAFSNDQTLMLFFTFEIFMLGIFMLGLFLRCITKLFTAPFLFIENPGTDPFKIIKLSGRIIYGSKLECLKLIFTYIIPMLPVVTIPFILPKALMSFSVFAKERIGVFDWEN